MTARLSPTFRTPLLALVWLLAGCPVPDDDTGSMSCTGQLVGQDIDGDGVCDDSDTCLGDDGTSDSDGDGVCDDTDVCLGNDADGDTDGDGTCDDVDHCAGADSSGDSDGDGVCDDSDACLGNDTTSDTDGDGLCDDLDLCFGENWTGDTDQDGVCDDTDVCLGSDALGDSDGDGVCNHPLDGCGVRDLGAQTGWVVQDGRDDYVANGGCQALPALDETLFRWTAPSAGTWMFTTNSFCNVDPELGLYEATCGGAELDRDQDTPGLFGNARLTRTLLKGEVVQIGLRPQQTGLTYYRIGLFITLGLETDCADGIDEDLDGDTDCEDLDCYTQEPACMDTGL